MRFPRLSILLLLTALVFSACSPGVSTPRPTPDLPTASATPGPSQTPSPSSTPTATALPTIGVPSSTLSGVSIQAWQAFAGPAAALFTRQVAQFNADNQWGILVDATGYGDYTSLFNSVTASLDSGQSPDLVVALPEQTLAWDARGAVVNLAPYIADPNWGLPSATVADIPSIFWQQDNVDGRQLGLPAERSARFIFYNLTWAHELGFPNPPSTPDEFEQQACAANASFLKDSDPQNDGYGGWIVDTDWQTTYSWLLAFDGGVVDRAAYGFRTDPNLAALQFIKGLFDQHCAWISTQPTPFDSFARRSALFITADLSDISSELGSMASLKNSDQWTLIPFPGLTSSVVVSYGPSFSLLKSTPEKQLASWLFAEWLLSPESQSQWVESTGFFPLRSSLEGLIAPYRLAFPMWVNAIGSLPDAQSVPQLASWRQVRYVLEDGMTVLFQENLSLDKLPTLLTEMDSMAQELK